MKEVEFIKFLKQFYKFLQDLLSTLFGAIKNADFGNILNSISGGADVNSKDPSTGNTALQMAIMAGLTEIVKVKYLVKYYA